MASAPPGWSPKEADDLPPYEATVTRWAGLRVARVGGEPPADGQTAAAWYAAGAAALCQVLPALRLMQGKQQLETPAAPGGPAPAGASHVPGVITGFFMARAGACCGALLLGPASSLLHSAQSLRRCYMLRRCTQAIHPARNSSAVSS